VVPWLEPGRAYGFHLDAEARLYPDPASRFQPEGPHGPSLMVDPSRFSWTDAAWTGVTRTGQVVYELHIGTFTPAGTFAAAGEQLRALAELGVTTIELMPLGDFPGRFGWGYDGVNLWAPSRLYGTPDDLRRLIDSAHRLGLGVILDVVYNHLGPDGNYLPSFSPAYLTDRHENEWGQAINFDGPDSAPVREFFVENAGYWIEEFHLDGLRLDATQTIHDASTEHVLTAITRRVRAAAGHRHTFVVAENEPQETRIVRPIDQGGHGGDSLWNDDFHHAAVVALTGRSEAYYSDYRGDPQELISAVRWGYLYQGQNYSWQGKRRGTPTLDLEATQFVNYLENHDQIANSARGQRLHQLTSPGQMRAMTALLLLAPGTPMLFQGQEFASTAPFLFFADHKDALGDQVATGRREFLSQFASLTTPEGQQVLALADPRSAETFARCKLDFAERERHEGVYALHRDLLALRRQDPAFRQQRWDRLYGAVLGADTFALRFIVDQDGSAGGARGQADRLLVVNLGRDVHLHVAPEPLLAPPAGCGWQTLWSSEDPRYGGGGTPQVERVEADAKNMWRILGRAAVVLAPRGRPS
jgi:maltooligosyltrehalose trehalohydrolase